MVDDEELPRGIFYERKRDKEDEKRERTLDGRVRAYV